MSQPHIDRLLLRLLKPPYQPYVKINIAIHQPRAALVLINTSTTKPSKSRGCLISFGLFLLRGLEGFAVLLHTPTPLFPQAPVIIDSAIPMQAKRLCDAESLHSIIGGDHFRRHEQCCLRQTCGAGQKMCTFFIESSKDRSHMSSAKMIDDERVRPGGDTGEKRDGVESNK